MAKKHPTITIQFKPGELPSVKIHSFEHMSHVKIERAFEEVNKEWNKLRAESIMERRRVERNPDYALQRAEERETIRKELAGVGNG